MGYVTESDLFTALDPLLQGGTAADLTGLDLVAAGVRAQAEVDLRLGVRYRVPIASPPQIVRDLTLDLAVYAATVQYHRGVPLDPGHPAVLRRDNALALLKDLQAGRAVLPVTTPPDAGSDQGQATAVNADWHDGAVFGSPVGSGYGRLGWGENGQAGAGGYSDGGYYGQGYPGAGR